MKTNGQLEHMIDELDCGPISWRGIEVGQMVAYSVVITCEYVYDDSDDGYVDSEAVKVCDAQVSTFGEEVRTASSAECREIAKILNEDRKWNERIDDLCMACCQ